MIPQVYFYEKGVYVMKKIQIFKIKNRRGYAAICDSHITEGRTPRLAKDRMLKALNRTAKRKKP